LKTTNKWSVSFQGLIKQCSYYFYDLNLWEATITAVSADIAAAGEEIFRRQVKCESGVRVNASSVGDRFGSAERPAGTTRTLISNLADRRTIWPLEKFVKLKNITNRGVKFKLLWQIQSKFLPLRENRNWPAAQDQRRSEDD